MEIKKVFRINGVVFGITGLLPEGEDTWGEIQIDTQLWGRAPTWEEVLTALYWGDNSIGQIIDMHAERAFRNPEITPQWRLEKHTGMSGCVDYILRAFVPARDISVSKYGMRGRITKSVHISCANKLNKGLPRFELWEWYIFSEGLPLRHHSERVKIYADNPPVEIAPVENLKWYSHGERPAEWDADAPEPETEKGGKAM